MPSTSSIPTREPAEALAGYIRAKLDFSRRHAAQSRMFANEAVHGGRFVTRKDRAHMLAVTLDKAKVFEAWAAAGKMDPVDPIHLFILLWATTQYYADFDVLAKSHLQTVAARRRRFRARRRDDHRDRAQGLRHRTGAGKPQRATRSAARLRG